jgi:hypothetical protein
VVAAQRSVGFLRGTPEKLRLKAVTQLRDLFERIDVNADGSVRRACGRRDGLTLAHPDDVGGVHRVSG